jgi:FMN reductase
MAERFVVGISGSQGGSSKTRRLVTAVAENVASVSGWRAELYDLTDIGALLGAAQGRADAPEALDRIWKAIETCDALVVGSPTYKASYSGLLKHLFDLLDMKALSDRPVTVVATGRAPGHALMIEHQMKPLFSFFGARITATGIYATDSDFDSTGQLGPALLEKVRKAADELRRLAG